MISAIRPALVLLGAFTVMTGLVYPAAVTTLAGAAFSQSANGSPIEVGGKVVGSELVGQAFTSPGYFWSRPSATGPFPYNGAASTGTNQGPTNPALADAVKARIEALRAADPGNTSPVPVDLVTASGSGLDPHISPAAALYQVGRVARARGLPEAEVRRMVEEAIESRTLGLLGAPRVHVLRLNLALDRRSPLRESATALR